MLQGGASHVTINVKVYGDVGDHWTAEYARVTWAEVSEHASGFLRQATEDSVNSDPDYDVPFPSQTPALLSDVTFILPRLSVRNMAILCAWLFPHTPRLLKMLLNTW